MARSASEQSAVSRSRAVLAADLQPAGGGITYRVAIAHTDSDHPSSATFWYGPAFNEQMADVVAHVRGVAPGEVDLLAEARTTMERARQEYPEVDGWQVSLEAVVPHADPEQDRHVIRRVEEG